MPNVALDGIGTGKGIANFSIRGIGVAGSIPSIDPTVGVFVDGVYLGVSYGVIMDMMDLEAVEVLRGPQGLLFGRNVTGGAVLFRSRRPSGETSAQVAARVETGLDKRLTGSVRDVVRGRQTRCAGVGELPGRRRLVRERVRRAAVRWGAESTWVLRPVLTWRGAAQWDVTAIYERGDSDGDGPPTQNRFPIQRVRLRQRRAGVLKGRVAAPGRRSEPAGGAGRRTDHQRRRLARGLAPVAGRHRCHERAGLPPVRVHGTAASEQRAALLGLAEPGLGGDVRRLHLQPGHPLPGAAGHTCRVGAFVRR